MKESFVEKRFNSSSIIIIDQANKIIEEYSKQGYSLTLRQLYYQFVSRDLIPNTQKSYRRLGSIINDARLCGFIDWKYISDLTRSIRRLSIWNNPADIIDSAIYSYRIDKWKYSPNYVEVWVEKDALIEIIEKASNVYQVPCFSCRGYVSQSAMYNASKRFVIKNRYGINCILLHLGDHDPSGIDMTRDIQERLNTFDAVVKVERIALNSNQIKSYKPPPNPAKITDSRYHQYRKEHGSESWELDALDPSILNELITKYILKYLDKKSYDEAVELEEEHKNKLREIILDLRSEYEE